MEKKRLYIIAGVTGALGNALLSKLLQDEDAVVYGISRQAQPWADFFCADTGLLHTKTFICSLGAMDHTSARDFIAAIDQKSFSSVTYVHALGHYPFEVTADGVLTVANDTDGDGINDVTLDLTYTKFTAVMDALCTLHTQHSTPVAGTIFGSLADEHQPAVHQSWWRTMEKVKAYMQTISAECGMHVLNISSVLCAHEVLSRPFVFIATDAQPQYWLQPHELAESLYAQFQSQSYFSGFDERPLYNHNPKFKKDYYTEAGDFTERKVSELFGKL